MTSLLTNRNGFGRNVTGGLGGRLIEVTNTNDSGAGSLRHALEQSGRRYVFMQSQLSGTCTTSSNISITDKNFTLDGRGADFTLSGYGLSIVGCDNWVISHIKFVDNDGAGPTDGDAIKVQQGSTDWWIHHCSFDGSTNQDGLIDVTQNTSSFMDGTIDYCSMTGHEKMMLIGNGAETYSTFRVTIHHCYFHGTDRQPLSSEGLCHIYNCHHDRFGGLSGDGSAQRVRFDGELYSEYNTAIMYNVNDTHWTGGTVTNPKSSAIREGEATGKVLSSNNWMLENTDGNRPTAVSFNESGIFDPSTYYSYTPDTFSDDSTALAFVSTLTSQAGWQNEPLNIWGSFPSILSGNHEISPARTYTEVVPA